MLSTAKKDLIKKEVLKRLDKTLDNNLDPTGVPVWLNIIYLLDIYNSGSFYGWLTVRMNGNSMGNFKIQEQTKKLEIEYIDIITKIEDED